MKIGVITICVSFLTTLQILTAGAGNLDRNNPAVMWIDTINTTTFTDRTEAGPWLSTDRNRRLKTIIPTRHESEEITRLLSMLAETLPTLISKQTSLIPTSQSSGSEKSGASIKPVLSVVDKHAADTFLKAEGFSSVPTRDELPNVMLIALSSYDVAVNLGFMVIGVRSPVIMQ